MRAPHAGTAVLFAPTRLQTALLHVAGETRRRGSECHAECHDDDALQGETRRAEELMEAVVGAVIWNSVLRMWAMLVVLGDDRDV